MSAPVDGRARGSVSVEVAVLAPAFIMLMVLAGVTGRTAVADEAVESAAHDAARAASISRDAATARAAARNAVRRQLDWRRLNCEGAPRITFSGSVRGRPAGFDAAYRSPVGEPASVTVAITCVVSHADLRAPGLPGVPLRTTASATFTSPLDRYRSRG
ncbi:TadE-like protein [Micromonospora coxensis]|uniref:TadE-like protein n=1 Tax=Micromonospora coxensis TaxID=356852 RepID=A0A1C5IWQ1_9ACTN|nr:TadE-like protein [Micromonospora coxensis]